MDCYNQRIPVWGLFCFSVLSDLSLLQKILAGNFAGFVGDLLVTVCFAVLTIILGYRFPAVSLYEEGVFVRRFFHTKKYEWKEFVQIGMGCLVRKPLIPLFDGVVFMLLPRSVKHNPKENFTQNKLDAFYVRNLFCMISFPVDQEELGIIQKYYGDLDFNVTIYSIYHKE